MVLAFPGQSCPSWETLARDSFFDALTYPYLRTGLLERDPRILDETVTIACRLEAISRPKVMTSDDSIDIGRRRDRFARVVEGPHNELMCDAKGRIGQPGAMLDSCCKEMDRYRLENACLRNNMESE